MMILVVLLWLLLLVRCRREMALAEELWLLLWLLLLFGGEDPFHLPQVWLDKRTDIELSKAVNFVSTNDIIGGNSGSPVINGRGELIGTNFDRNWEGTMSDIMFDPDRVRNITLDVRYMLFVVDKFAGAGHLVKEMTLVGGPETATDLAPGNKVKKVKMKRKKG